MRVVCQERAEGKTAGKKRVEVEGRPARRLECARRQKGARRHVLLFTCGCMKWLCRSHNRWQECEMVVQCA